jgi:hypothetical protein
LGKPTGALLIGHRSYLSHAGSYISHIERIYEYGCAAGNLFQCPAAA